MGFIHFWFVTCELQEVGVLVDAGCTNRECCICHAPVTDLGSRRQRLCDVGNRFVGDLWIDTD